MIKIFDHPIDGKVDPHHSFGDRNSFGHLEEVFKKITKKIGCLNYSHFLSLEYFPFLVIVSLVIAYFFPH
jgi:hypothetical protein